MIEMEDIDNVTLDYHTETRFKGVKQEKTGQRQSSVYNQRGEGGERFEDD